MPKGIKKMNVFKIHTTLLEVQHYNKYMKHISVYYRKGNSNAEITT